MINKLTPSPRYPVVLLLTLCFLFLFSISGITQTNYAVNFNGGPSADCGNNAGLNAPGTTFTVEAWVYHTGFGGNRWDGTIISDEGNINDGLVLRSGGAGVLSFAFGVPGGAFPEVISANNVLALNKWQHVAGVYNGSQMMVYVDGVLVGTTSEIRSLVPNNTLPMKIGASSNFPTRVFFGHIDEVRTWSVARTQANIKDDMFRHISTGTGLVSSYQMSNGSGTTITDNSGNGNTATLSAGATWVASPIQSAGNAIDFDGIDDDVIIPHHSSLNITSAITLEAWVYATKNTGVQNVMAKSSAAENYGYIFPRTDNGWANLSLYLFIGGGWRVLSAAYPSLNAWHHVAATYDGATMTIYIDGALAASMPQTGSIATNNAPLELGVQNGYPAEFFGGRADEFRIWNVARTQGQIQAGMNRELNPSIQTGLVSYYTANQGIAAGNNAGLLTLVDRAGVNNGVLDGFLLNGSSSNYVAQNNTLVLLPVQWLSFTVQPQGDHHALLKWSTASEHNTQDYTVQRSGNGSEWQNIGNIKASGSSNQVSNYHFTDLSNLKGLNYYRLLQRDFDGNHSYSAVRIVSFDVEQSSFTVLANPITNKQLTIQVNNNLNPLSLYNSNGFLIWNKQLNAGTTTIDLSGLAKGVYLLKAGKQAERILIR